MLLARKARSFVIVTARDVASAIRILICKLLYPGVSFARRVQISDGVQLRTHDDGRIMIGEGTSIGRGSEIVGGGGVVWIGRNVRIGRGCVIVARSSIRIGDGTQLAEYVTIRDQDHDTNGDTPVRSSGFLVDAIEIENDVWIGAKASVLRGSKVGSRSVVAAHAVVKSVVPADVVVVGIPAKIKARRNG